MYFGPPFGVTIAGTPLASASSTTFPNVIGMGRKHKEIHVRVRRGQRLAAATRPAKRASGSCARNSASSPALTDDQELLAFAMPIAFSSR